MLHAGLDLSRKRLDVCLLGDDGEHLDQLAVSPDVDSLKKLARRIEEVHREPVCAVIESMTGARIVHDTLEQAGWSASELIDARPQMSPGGVTLASAPHRLQWRGPLRPLLAHWRR